MLSRFCSYIAKQEYGYSLSAPKSQIINLFNGKKKKILTSTSVHSTNIQLDLEKKWTWLNYVSEN